jgi:7-carboxy-7-deazaguanine synthase
MNPDLLNVSELFHSIQGESSYAGLPCAFARLAGCNLRCSYCDTSYAWESGTDMPVAEVADRLCGFGCRQIEITGGEPLLQPGVPGLARTLLDRGRTVLVETNGTRDISLLPEGVIRVMDVKCPGSGESGRMDWDNVGRLRKSDEVKFVLSDERDYRWALDCIRSRRLEEKAVILLAPAAGRLDPARLAEWMLRDGADARLQLQLHRILWPGQGRGR